MFNKIVIDLDGTDQIIISKLEMIYSELEDANSEKRNSKKIKLLNEIKKYVDYIDIELKVSNSEWIYEDNILESDL